MNTENETNIVREQLRALLINPSTPEEQPKRPNALQALAALRKSQYSSLGMTPPDPVLEKRQRVQQKIYKLSAEIHELSGTISAKNEEIRWLLGELQQLNNPDNE